LPAAKGDRDRYILFPDSFGLTLKKLALRFSKKRPGDLTRQETYLFPSR
jgi:hypothetical protein